MRFLEHQESEEAWQKVVFIALLSFLVLILIIIFIFFLTQKRGAKRKLSKKVVIMPIIEVYELSDSYNRRVAVNESKLNIMNIQIPSVL